MGVLEFNVPEETCHMPMWILEFLCADVGDVGNLLLYIALVVICAFIYNRRRATFWHDGYNVSFPKSSNVALSSPHDKRLGSLLQVESVFVDFTTGGLCPSMCSNNAWSDLKAWEILSMSTNQLAVVTKPEEEPVVTSGSVPRF